MKKFICTADNSNWLNSIESACLYVTSPTGKTIRISKIALRNVSDKERKLVWRCVGDEMIRQTERKVKLTIQEMETLLRLSKI